mmetsp:Transcript_66673/g.97517  ORF Transcript_66673/g.97517 Transcript_66673/m.97517 type:complete len:97 (-) Transcript_66673:670-960(-)
MENKGDLLQKSTHLHALCNVDCATVETFARCLLVLLWESMENEYGTEKERGQQRERERVIYYRNLHIYRPCATSSARMSSMSASSSSSSILRSTGS